ncbi:hypothetical protein EMQ25_15620 [Arsenicitalea aurantiaca]|uniref:Uncharacterized protein n=1 Tax=Arsenicitalea aurantiaca TaxID=1783274 RepID=A0A433X422_9HYPH|nr:hypothetical protein [Arsenicitalea aurantiaca]RUT28816.1 hypothetical protein EMQ25_15620 [Arsenicitalea aurantiaca]
MVEHRETVVVDRGGGSGLAIAGGIAAVLLIVLAFLYFNGTFGGSGGSVAVDVPAVNVDVAPAGQ